MRGKKLKNIAFFAGAVILTVAAVLLAGHVSGEILVAGLGAALTALGAILFILGRRERLANRMMNTRWRDVMPCYLSIQDHDLRIIDTNKLFERDFGMRIGERCFKVYKNSSVPCPECPVLMSFKDGQVHTSEEAVIGMDGRVANVVVTSAPLVNAKGEIVAVMEMSTNITEINALRHELEQTRRDYKHLFEAVPCYICVLDEELNILEANTLYEQDFDITRGSRCFEVCKGRTKACPDCLVTLTFQDGHVHTSEERLTTRDGRMLELVVYSMPIRGETGEITAVMEVFTDITEIKRLQRQLALMGRAVAGVAHRIKNMLMGLEGGIFVCNTGMETRDQGMMEEGWEMVERNVKKVSRLVKDLLYCSKERKPSFQSNVCPHEILRDVHATYAERLSGDNIELRLEMEAGADCGTFDPDGLYNLLTNLLANAIDACRFDQSGDKSSHTISMRCHRDAAGNIVIEVQDDGAGIPDEVSDKVFEDFFSTKGTEGTGIGLLVVQKVAEEHGGQVRFSSQAGKGTTFTVTFPPD